MFSSRNRVSIPLSRHDPVIRVRSLLGASFFVCCGCDVRSITFVGVGMAGS